LPDDTTCRWHLSRPGPGQPRGSIRTGR